MQIVDTRSPQAKQENRIFRAIGCTAVYLTSAGALCSMAGLGRTLLGAWGLARCCCWRSVFCRSKQRFKVSSGFLSFCCLALRCGFCGSPRATAFAFS